ncbi:hypothetical protein GCM10012275_62040 [Longimycelium tulufanense]|uniref:Uncharacterized protein n=1 Tax=Longimycelium tulufanense TaxID=907463 RepID=A0A8J3CLG5_9PSEU|nr:hypothetical protein [Longimycelium tulufanense]GGM83059.1 hypothetical protein GCM10012275_62040 [Longimycelium tulufanense]
MPEDDHKHAGNADVALSEITDLAHQILARATRGARRIEVDGQYYWTPPLDSVLDIYTERPELVMGDAGETMRNLHRYLEDEDAPYHAQALAWLGQLLQVVAARINQ